MAASLKHLSLGTTLLGVREADMSFFRGIPYAKVPRRFAAAVPVSNIGEEVDCRQFGPRCPQMKIDGRYLLRIPDSVYLPEEEEDEFACTNLDICAPSAHLDLEINQDAKLPVLVWIHGGSQAVTFGSAKSGICDPVALVRDSIQMGKPIIVVNVQYRLNIFALSDGNGPANLALRDQRLALDWIQDHITGFGGNPADVTVYGESAGAVYAHAQLVTGAPARQFILASGCLHLSPPQPTESTKNLRSIVLKQLKQVSEESTLEHASVEQILEAIDKTSIRSWFLQQEESLENWQETTGGAERVLLTDVQKEAVIWQEGVWFTKTQDIVKAFEAAGDAGDSLKRMYHICPDRPTSCRLGALDFINDYKFVLPLERMRRVWMDAGKSVFRALLDESNPWQPSSGAHHAIDVLLLFGGFDLAFAPAAERTAVRMRQAWIDFVSNGDPWSPKDGYYGFGPHGHAGLLDDVEVQSRRRMTEVNVLGKMDPSALDKVFFALASGKVSLLN